ncbi:MAG: hypothetical protein QW757_05770 [Candidatus Woesearchaeota archaeon]
MKTIYWLIFILILIFIGESLAIYTEVASAKLNKNKEASFFNILTKMFFFILIANISIILGYYLGVIYFKNIWIISVISITSIIIVELILVWLFFKEIPSLGSIIGFVLGTIGLLFSLFF